MRAASISFVLSVMVAFFGVSCDAPGNKVSNDKEEGAAGGDAKAANGSADASGDAGVANGTAGENEGVAAGSPKTGGGAVVDAAKAKVEAVKDAVGAAGAVDPALAAIDQFIAASNINRENQSWRTRLPKPAKVTFDAAKKYYWNIKTNKGDIKVQLNPAVAPMHVTSTIYLTKLGFYDGLIFHRVIPGFMAQGGCPVGRGTGGPGYQYGGEFSPDLRHDRGGLLSMANSGPGTDGSQFFLTFVPTSHLDDKHTIFGAVVEGMETVKLLESLGTGGRGTPKERLIMEKCTISVE